MKNYSLLLLSLFIIIVLNLSCNTKQITQEEKIIAVFNNSNQKIGVKNMEEKKEVAILGAGCFWCVEAAFQSLKGVTFVKSGYTGGHTENPTYKDICTGETGHAEVVKVDFDPNIISYDEILAAYFTVHDPTQLNRQGNDIGTQYRSAIFPTNESQEAKAYFYINKLNQESVYPQKVVTTVEPFVKFYPAEPYHDDYYNNNPDNPYCQMVVKPKLEKFRKIFGTAQ